MRTTILAITTIGAWAMAIAYDLIKRTTGTELTVLLIGPIVTIGVGLYLGLYRNNKNEHREEL